MKNSIKMAVAVIIAGVSMVHALERISIQKATASATLPNQGKNNYDPQNMLKLDGVWAATFKGQPISLEFSLKADRVDALIVHNGYRRDEKSYDNNSLIKTASIYLNSKKNLVKKVVMQKNEFYEDDGGTAPDIITFEKPLENVQKLIVEIEDILPGKKWKDVCVTYVEVMGYAKKPVQGKTETVTDSRDGNTYGTIQIGTQTWMAENLRHKTAGSRPFTSTEQNDSKLVSQAGFEYPDQDVMKGICPSGWHIPSSSDYAKIYKAGYTLDDIIIASAKAMVYNHSEKSLFYPTNVSGLNFTTLTRHYYDGECSEDYGEATAFSGYWTSDTRMVDVNGEKRPLRHIRLGGSDYCEAMQSKNDGPEYYFIRCVKD